MMLALSAQSFGIVAGFFSTTGLGAWALIRSSRGDKALSTANNATSLWAQTTALINELQEENTRHLAMISACEQKCVDCGASSELLKVELAALRLDHARLVVKIERLEAQL